MDNEIKKYIKSIIKTLLFLLIMTVYWYGPREDLTNLVASIGDKYASRNIDLKTNNDIRLDNKEVTYKIINKINKKQGYIITINNDYFKQRKDNCKIVSNNYLKYNLKIADEYEENRNLNSDSIIYTDVLKPNEIKEFSIRIEMDKDDIKKDECYYPVVKVSTYNKI